MGVTTATARTTLAALGLAAGAIQTASLPTREQMLTELTSNPQLIAAAPDAGRAVFEKVCATCHTFGAVGKEVGPDLTAIASRMKRPELVESILWPSRTIPDQYQMTLIETKAGDFVGGMVRREDAVRVVIVTAQALDKPITVPKTQIKFRKKSTTSLMPEDLLAEFSLPQVAGLVAFLLAGPPR